MRKTAVRVPRMRRKTDGFAVYYAKRLLRTSLRLINEMKKRLQWNKNSIYRLSEPPGEKPRALEIAAFSAKKHRIPLRAAWPAQF